MNNEEIIHPGSIRETSAMINAEDDPVSKKCDVHFISTETTHPHRCPVQCFSDRERVFQLIFYSKKQTEGLIYMTGTKEV